MPSYQVNDDSPGYGRSGSYSNYGYSGRDSRDTMGMKERYDRPPAYSSRELGSRTTSKKENQQRHSRSKSVVQAPLSTDSAEYERGHWGSKAEFILSCIGYSVGIGNVWRFPYLAYQNGGAAFLVPYFILLILVGKPMYYMETALGQFARLSPLQVWRCAPIATGVGVGMVILSTIVAIYYNVIMAYSIIYVGASFRGISEELPWSYCGAWWGADDDCVTRFNLTEQQKEILAKPRCNAYRTENCSSLQSSPEQFWEKYILDIGPGLQEPGDLNGFKYDLPMALALSWVIVFLCLMKGVKSSGKVVYFTATFPYAVLIALLVKGVTLSGAKNGLYYLFVPDWPKLLDPVVWRKAAEQMFFSLGVSWGGLIMFGSYNKFHNKIHIDAAIVSSLDFFTSIISSCVVFSVLGFLSAKTGIDIKDVAKGGQGLAFVAYPEALASLPLPWLWSILFFLMLFFLGLDSEFALLETSLTALYDGFPTLRSHKVKVTALGCIACFLMGLPCVSSNGQYVLDLMDTYGAGFAVLWIALWEVVALMWIYGFKNFSKDIALMIGSEPMFFTKICWVVFCPIILLVIFVMALYFWEQPTYSGSIPYPDWAHWLGWGLVGISAVQVPLWAAIMSLVYCCKRKITRVASPTKLWGPGDSQVRKAIFEEQNGIAPRKPIYGGYDNHAISAY